MIACATDKHVTEIGSRWGVRTLSVQWRRRLQTDAAPMMRIMICCRLQAGFMCFCLPARVAVVARLWLKAEECDKQ